MLYLSGLIYVFLVAGLRITSWRRIRGVNVRLRVFRTECKSVIGFTFQAIVFIDAEGWVCVAKLSVLMPRPGIETRSSSPQPITLSTQLFHLQLLIVLFEHIKQCVK
jgi:hypothetical protein